VEKNRKVLLLVSTHDDNHEEQKTKKYNTARYFIPKLLETQFNKNKD